MRTVYLITICLGALLLFAVQPLVGRLLLPALGGSPSVWNTCMVFFQAVLLAGYAYAHFLGRLREPRQQVLVHVIVLAVAVAGLPIALRSLGNLPDDGSPVPWLLGALLATAGLPFFVVSTTGPLLQKWFSLTDDRGAADPYFLYAASNAGSLAALLAYPIVVEPLLGLNAQSWTWSAGYAIFAAGTLACGALAIRRRASAPPEGAHAVDLAPPRAADWGRWIALAFVPSSLMLGATTHITTDVAAVPLFWVVPLAVYLLTFILAFARRRLLSTRSASVFLIAVTVPALASSFHWAALPVGKILLLHLALLFAASLALHSRLADLRPAAAHLTRYYLAIAIGGALGGVFNAIVAPLLFDSVMEYPLAIALAVLLRQRIAAGKVPTPTGIWVNRTLDAATVALALCYQPMYADIPGSIVLERDRTFFGTHWVCTDQDRRLLFHGSTLHGVQVVTNPHDPRGYYYRDSGIGRVFSQLAGDPRLEHVAVVGLGSGALAAYAEPGRRFTFYEIDPAIVTLASRPELFTYLTDAPESPRIVLGDGRRSLSREADGTYGLIVVDAFSSDSIPVHLLTAEAVELYFRKLRPDGLLALHVTNRHLDLVRLAAGLADRLGLTARGWSGVAERDFEQGILVAHWLVLARDGAAVAALDADPGWVPLTAAQPVVWTDDYSNLVELLEWRD